MPDDDLNKAIQLIKAGKKAEAQLVLEPYIQAHPQSIQAWMWEVELFPDDHDKIRVLEICLEHNPDHAQVLRALAELELRVEYKSTKTTPPPAPAVAPFHKTAPPPVSMEPTFHFERTPTVPKKSVPQAPVSQTPIKRKHPDWPTTDGVVNVSRVRQVQTGYSRSFMADIVAIYVVGRQDYSIKHPRARRGSFTPFDPEMLVSSNPPGKGVTVSYNPKNPGRAWVDEWDESQTHQQLKNFKEKPEVRQALSKRYRSFMLSGLGLIALGGIASVVGTMLLIPLGFAYIAFTGMLALGILSFLVGLVGWMWYWD